MIKGFSVSRSILSISNDDFAEPTATSVAYRWDIKGNYGAIVGATYSDIVTCQDCHVRSFPAANSSTFTGYQIKTKIHALPSQYCMLDTTSAPGALSNMNYWDAHFTMGAKRPFN